MLPLVDKPIIQYGVEEALASDVRNIILVTGRGKNAIEDHFDVSVELETFLEARGKKDLLDEIRNISNLMNVSYVRQGEPLGLGHAVLVTETIIGNEPFAVILADDVIDADPPALKQMIDVFDRVGGPVLLVERVAPEQVSSYGVIAIDESADLGKGVYKIADLVEKPRREDAPSYTSGLLIGGDVRIGLESVPPAARVAVMGRPELTRLYAAAIAIAGREAFELDGERCFVAGIRQIAERIE
jgi:UTP--glucose-1-phosphate uridylyltransferase